MRQPFPFAVGDEVEYRFVTDHDSHKESASKLRLLEPGTVVFEVHCHTVVTLFLHCCHTVVTLSLHWFIFLLQY
jgi:hypothetical protein